MGQNLYDFMHHLGVLIKEDEHPDVYINSITLEVMDNRYKEDAHPNDKNSKAVKGASKGKLKGLKSEWIGYKLNYGSKA